MQCDPVFFLRVSLPGCCLILAAAAAATAQHTANCTAASVCRMLQVVLEAVGGLPPASLHRHV